MLLQDRKFEIFLNYLLPFEHNDCSIPIQILSATVLYSHKVIRFQITGSLFPVWQITPNNM